MGSTAAAVAVAMVVLMMSGTRLAEGQADCASKLIPCVDYLNSTNPSKECCDSMRDVVTTQLDCLCGLIRNPGLLGGINMTQALQLPKYCNVSSDTSVCTGKGAPAPTASIPPPAVPGGNGGNGAGDRVSGMGVTALFFASALAFFY